MERIKLTQEQVDMIDRRISAHVRFLTLDNFGNVLRDIYVQGFSDAQQAAQRREEPKEAEHENH